MRRTLTLLVALLACSLPAAAQRVDGGVRVNGVTQGGALLGAGTGSGSFRASGVMCQNPTTITDSGVQNQWNVATCALASNTLGPTNDAIVIDAAWLTAANANNKGSQIYFAPSSATCSGSGATLCSAGCQLTGSLGTSVSATNIAYYLTVMRTSAGNQKFYGIATAGSSVYSTFLGTCTVDETLGTQIAFGVRNIDAAAAVVTTSIGPVVRYVPGR